MSDRKETLRKYLGVLNARCLLMIQNSKQGIGSKKKKLPYWSSQKQFANHYRYYVNSTERRSANWGEVLWAWDKIRDLNNYSEENIKYYLVSGNSGR